MSRMTQSWSLSMYAVYTLISHMNFRLRAIEYFVNYYRQSINPRFTTQFILEAANFILSNNSTTFYEMFYLTAMGTILMK